MHCPVCNNVNLVMSERQGIEIDYCPQCRGVWLDRGELDKIIERSIVTPPVQQAQSTSMRQQSTPSYNQQPQQQHQQHQQHQQSHSGHYKKKKEGFLSDLFDFD
jgi:Zn-finger nucleic acid-binding protein